MSTSSTIDEFFKNSSKPPSGKWFRAKHAHHKSKQMLEWGYSEDDGPDSWSENFPEGRGKRQSPIDIDLNSDRVRFDSKLGNLYFDYEECHALSIFNNGHGFQVKFDLKSPASKLQKKINLMPHAYEYLSSYVWWSLW